MSKKTPTQWIPVEERMPENFVSVLGHIKDAGPFPSVRECYTVGNAFYFPALQDAYHVSHWMPMPEPPKEKVYSKSEYRRIAIQEGYTDDKSVSSNTDNT